MYAAIKILLCLFIRKSWHWRLFKPCVKNAEWNYR